MTESPSVKNEREEHKDLPQILVFDPVTGIIKQQTPSEFQLQNRFRRSRTIPTTIKINRMPKAGCKECLGRSHGLKRIVEGTVVGYIPCGCTKPTRYIYG